jgi:hypothetical protein
MSCSPAKQTVVGCQENVGPAELGARQMQGVENAEPKLLKERGALGRAWSRDHDFIGEAEERGNIVPPVRIRVAADLDLQCRAAHPGCPPFAYHPENAFNRCGFAANAGLALIVRQTVQATGIQIESQSQRFFREAEITPCTGAPILSE